MSDDDRSRLITGQTLKRILIAVLVLAAVSFAIGPVVSNLFSNSVEVTDVTLHAPDGPSATFIGNGDANLTAPFPDANTVEFNSTFANVTVQSTGRTNITFQTLSSSWINASDIDASNIEIEVFRSNFEYIAVTNEIGQFNLSDTVALDDGQVDFVYNGTNGQTSTITISGVPANDEIYAVEAGGVTTLGSATSNASGFVTLDLSNSRHSVTLQTQSNNHSPSIDEDTASPVGDQNDFPGQLEVNVTDADFGDGDTVDLTWELDGNQVGTQTISSNGSYSQSVNINDGGQHNWTITAEDDSGAKDTATFSFTTPENGSVFEELNPETRITDKVNLTFYPQDSDRVYNRNTTNGNFSLVDLPLNQDIVIVAESRNYYDRHITIESLAEQPRIYMLHENDSVVNTTFTLTDRTGNFPPESTVLKVKKPINRTRDGNKTTEFEVMAGDVFGQDGYPTILQSDTRYRLLVKNQDDDINLLDEYTTGTEDVDAPLSVGQINATLVTKDGYGYNATKLSSQSGEYIRFQYVDTENETTDLDVSIYERGNESNEIFQQTFVGPVGNVTITDPLTPEQANKTWVVAYDARRYDNDIGATLPVGDDQIPVLGDMPWWLRQFFALSMIFVVGGLASQVNAETGAVTIAMTGGLFWFVGFLPSEVGGGIAVLALLFSGAWYLRTRTRPV